MIYLIIGGSCCGKTSFVKNTWLKNKKFETKKDIIPYVETNEAILLGRYSNIDGRERSGTDTISRRQIPLIATAVKSFMGCGKDIVLEGDKATSRNLFNEIVSYGDTTLILIHCNIEISLKRNKELNSIVKDSTLKGALTKAKNIFAEYRDRMTSISIDTSHFTKQDFKQFALCNYKDFIKECNSDLTLF